MNLEKSVMKLELKHLAPYLPYGLKGLNQIDKEVELTASEISYRLSKGFKPILRPLSDLTKEIQIAEFYMTFQNHLCRISGLDIDLDLNIETPDYQILIELDQLRLINDFLFKHHFDVFGLIDKSLAIDINTL